MNQQSVLFTPHNPSRRIMLLCALLYIVLTFALIFFGKENVDEGYYQIVARQTSLGDLPYRDYIYVQTPLFPIVYGMAFKLFGTSFAFARGFSGFLGFIAFLVCVITARRLGGDQAGAVTAALIVCQPFTLYFLMIIKLYALTGLCVALAVFFLCSQYPLRFPAAAACLALGTATRMTLAPTIPLIIAIAAFRSRSVRMTLLTATVCIILLTGILLPFFLLAPETFLYDVFTYHFEKESFSLLRQISHRLDSLFKLSNIYFLPLLLFFSTTLYRFRFRTDPSALPEARHPGERDAGLVLLIIILFHFTAQAPYIYRYLAMLAPAVCILIGTETARFRSLIPTHLKAPINGMIWGACLLTLIARGHVDFSFRDGGAFVQLSRVAARIKSLVPPEKPILTFNNSVAVEANREVVRGDEMNVLTYDPAWPRERCEKFVILNLEMLESLIQSRTFGAILMTPYSFLGNFPRFFNPGEIGARPRILKAIEENYMQLTEFKGFGYLGEDATLLIPVRSRSSRNSEGEVLQFNSNVPGNSLPLQEMEGSNR